MYKKVNSSFLNFIDHRELDQLVEYVYNIFYAQGKINKIMDYDYTVTPEDIKSEIKVCLISRLGNYNPKRIPLQKYALICGQEAITNFYKSGAREGMITRNVNGTEVTDEKYQVYRNRYTFLDIKSKRKKTSVEEFHDTDDNDRYDFFERNLIPNDYVKSSEEILIEREEIILSERKERSSLRERIRALLENSGNPGSSPAGNGRKRKLIIKRVYPK